VAPGLFLSAEPHYMRAYDGAALNSYVGNALFIGPTLYYAVNDPQRDAGLERTGSGKIR
jgi:hypothetical protein